MVGVGRRECLRGARTAQRGQGSEGDDRPRRMPSTFGLDHPHHPRAVATCYLMGSQFESSPAWTGQPDSLCTRYCVLRSCGPHAESEGLPSVVRGKLQPQSSAVSAQADPIQRQLDAFDAHHLGAFVARCASDVSDHASGCAAVVAKSARHGHRHGSRRDLMACVTGLRCPFRLDSVTVCPIWARALKKAR